MGVDEFKDYMNGWSDAEIVAYAEDAVFVAQLSTEELNELVFELSKRLASKTAEEEEGEIMGIPIGGEDDAL